MFAQMLASWTPAVGAAQRWWAKAVCAARLIGVLLRSWLRSATGTGGSASGRAPTLYKVYAFNEALGDGDAGGFYRELSPHLFDPDCWEDLVANATGWTNFRVEIRYTYRHKKYRMVLRRGNACVFPPYSEPSAPTCRLPKGVLSARLQGPLGSDIQCDVTRRVLKYQGPRGDFHAGLGLKVRLQDMFPFDDHNDNAARFTHLRVLDTMARVHDMGYASNLEMGR